MEEITDIQEIAPNDSEIIKQELDRIYREDLHSKIEPYILRANDYLPPCKPVVSINGTTVCSLGNISAVVGEAKSKKTFLCTGIVGSMLDMCRSQLFGIEHNFCKVLWIDTEQAREHIQKVLFRINILGMLPIITPNPAILMQTLREESPSKRMQIVRYAIEYHKPKLVVIDGVSDLLCNTNNLEESERLVANLLSLSSICDCHIMNVLHTNPSSDKARGHLGSTLMRKAETVMFVHRVGDVSIVEPQYCRNMPFERFAFRVEEVEDAPLHGPQCVGLGIPVECEVPAQEDNTKEEDCVRILRDELGGVAERKLLYTKMVEKLGITTNYARVKVTRATNKGLLRAVDDESVSVV